MHLHVEEHGSGAPTLVLLHGLSANGAVWSPLVERLRPRFAGRILVPDLRGHGRSPHATHYGYGQHAADVAALLAPGEPVHVVGHSMGAAIGLVLASSCAPASWRTARTAGRGGTRVKVIDVGEGEPRSGAPHDDALPPRF